jgi:hypothetical protein
LIDTPPPPANNTESPMEAYMYGTLQRAGVSCRAVTPRLLVDFCTPAVYIMTKE